MLSRNNDLEAKVAALTAEKEHLEQQRVREMRELALEHLDGKTGLQGNRVGNALLPC